MWRVNPGIMGCTLQIPLKQVRNTKEEEEGRNFYELLPPPCKKAPNVFEYNTVKMLLLYPMVHCS